MEIERAWTQEPGWFQRQTGSQKARLLAWSRVHHDPSGKAAQKRKSKSAREFWGVG